jgi:hypothetical protein
MTLDVFPDPRADVAALLTAAKPSRWPTATITTTFPTSSQIAAPVIQHAWDGSPSEQANRQVVTIRVTCWTPKGKVSDGIALAQMVRAYLLDSGSATTWRFRRGPGPAPGVDKASGLPFCTFTLTAETRPTRVA